MKTKVSRLFAVTLLTPKRIVRSSLPWRDKDLSWGMGCGWQPPPPEGIRARSSLG